MLDALWLDLGRDVFHYKFTAILLLFRFGYIFFFRKHSKLIKERLPRPPSDATWFLPVHVWGIESLFHLGWWFALFLRGVKISSPGPDRLHPGLLEHGFFSASVLIVVVGLCYLQEHLAWCAGLGVRESQATIPLSVMISILGVWFVWISYFSLLSIKFIPMIS